MLQAVAPAGNQRFELSVLESRLEIMRQEIIEARSVQECLRLSDAAEAVLSLFKIAGALVEDQNRVAEMKIDAERKAGEMLARSDKNKGGQPKKNRHHVDTGSLVDADPSYADMAAAIGASPNRFRNTAQRTQLIAEVPDRFPCGSHRTFRIYTMRATAKFAPGKRVVGMLIGPDNESLSDYEGFAFCDDTGIQVWKRFRGKKQEEYAGLLWGLATGCEADGHELMVSRVKRT